MSSPHSAMYLRSASDGGGSMPREAPLQYPLPPTPSLLVDPVLAEAMAGVIKGMKK